MWLLWIAACARETIATPTGLPDRAPAVTLLASIGPTGVTVAEATPGRGWVDLDQPDDTRYGFRYRLLDPSGETVYARGTLGPVLVTSFLDYWSETSGFDILGAFPTLGAFPVQVPLVGDASVVAFDVRDAAGDFVERGRFDLAAVDALPARRSEAVVGWETLHAGGPPAQTLDLAIVGDGFRDDELPAFREATDAIVAALRDTEPFRSHLDQLNLYRVDAVSDASGVAYDCVGGCGPLDTAFDSIYAIEAVNALMGTTYDTRAIFQADQWEVARAVDVVPWDAVLVVANTTKFGGMAVHYATTTLHVGYAETAVHELGHAIGLLGDEYTGDACIRSESLGLPENITDSPEDPPWAHWVAPSTPLPTPDGAVAEDAIGAFAPAFNCPDLYRPRAHCLMNDTGPFCAVCAELMTRRLWRFSDPADDIALAPDAEGWVATVTGRPGSAVVVRVDGSEVARGTADAPIAFPAAQGATVEVTVEVDEPGVRADPEGDLLQTRRWTIDRAP